MRISLKKIFTCIVVMWICIGCMPRHREISILDNAICEPPCWQNITPGLTTRQDFLDFIENYQYLEGGSLHDYNESWQSFSDLIRGRLLFESKTITYFDTFLLDDTVAVLSFNGSWNITLDQVISILGEPTNVLIISYGNDIFVKLIIPSKGIAFGYSTIDGPSSWKLNIQPDIRINSIDYFSPGVFQQMLDTGLLSYGLLDTDEALQTMHLWKGYGNIEKLYTPITP